MVVVVLVTIMMMVMMIMIMISRTTYPTLTAAIVLSACMTAYSLMKENSRDLKMFAQFCPTFFTAHAKTVSKL